jgi:hypothetical protein
MEGMQELIHKLEVEGGMRYLRWGLLTVLAVLLAVGYNLRDFKNMSTQEAMDSAQVARNLAQGKGFTTLFIRPFSLYLVKEHNTAPAGAEAVSDPTRLKGLHPDLANAPLYPTLEAGLMKALPFHYNANRVGNGFWSNGGRCWRYQPDFFISLFNQVLFLGVVLVSFLLAKRLFDPSVAWCSAAIILGTELFWRFSVSGLSTMLLMLIFMGLTWTLVLLEEEGRESLGGPGRILMLGLGAGLLLGAGALTRYSFGWLFLPVLGFALLFGGTRRLLVALAIFIGFAALLTPWVARNYSVSGTPFGTAGYALVETTGTFTEHPLQTTLQPNMNQGFVSFASHKLVANARHIVEEELPRLGGNWLSAFFLVGLLVSFRQPSIARLRGFLIAALAVLVVVQALGRTPLSDASPFLNSENLLVVVAPLVFIFGVALFFLLFEQIELPMREMRYGVLVLFGAVMCLPMFFALFATRPNPVSYPPYYPPVPQLAGSFAREDELTASDMPWAIAWYGRRQCVWAATPADLVTINDFQKPVQVLYLSSLTLNGRFTEEWMPAGQQTWGTLVLQSLSYLGPARKAWQTEGGPYQINLGLPQLSGAPVAFPLHYWQPGWPDAFLLTSRDKPLKSQ